MIRFKQAGPVLISVAVFLLLVTAASLRYPHFFSYGVALDLVRDNAFLGIVVVGMTFVILTGGIDLSVGAVLGFSSIFAAKLMQQSHWPAWQAVLCVLAIGTCFGALMGYLISRFDLPPFLVTLAGMFVARGAALLVSRESISIEDRFYSELSSNRYALPVLLIVVLVLAAYLLNFRPFGRNIYAVGGNESSARLMGVPVLSVKTTVYAISGLCAALAGIAYGIYTVSGNATAGTLLELDAIAAVVIGGTLLAGGVGGLWGSMVGVLMLGLIQTAISFEGTLSSWWAKVATGVLLLLFILPQKLLVSTKTS